MSEGPETTEIPPHWNGLPTGTLYLKDPEEGLSISLDGYHYDDCVAMGITVLDWDDLMARDEEDRELQFILNAAHLRALAAWATAVADEIDKGGPRSDLLPLDNRPVPEWKPGVNK